jgi:hypothetical protein
MLLSFVDRDMVMRYHWGLAVGHVYSHPYSEPQCGEAPESNSKSCLPDDRTGVLVDGVLEFEVEAILDSRVRQGRVEYLIHWKGYSHEEDTWEPEDNVKNSAHLIRQFHLDNPSAPRCEDYRIGADTEDDADSGDDELFNDESQSSDGLEGDDGGDDLNALELHEMYGLSQDYDVYE